MPTPELSTLKILWQSTLSEAEKSFWRQQLTTPSASMAELRNCIREELKIDLQHDSQLYEFRQWEMAQRTASIHDERYTRERHRLTQEHPEWDSARVHEELLRQICLQAAFDSNETTALKAIRAAANYSTLDLHREKFKESRSSKIKSGVETLRKEADTNPTFRAAMEKFREAIHAAFPEEFDITDFTPTSNYSI